MAKSKSRKPKAKTDQPDDAGEVVWPIAAPKSLLESKDLSLEPSDPPASPPPRRNKGWVELDNETNREVYLEALARTGQYMTAADAVGCDRRTALRLRAADPEFAEQGEIALERYRDVLVAELHRRAVDGVDVAVIGGQFKDEIILYEKKYSDRLLELAVKRHVPEFRDQSKVEQSGAVTVHHSIDLSALTREQRDMVRKLIGDGEPEK